MNLNSDLNWFIGEMMQLLLKMLARQETQIKHMLDFSTQMLRIVNSILFAIVFYFYFLFSCCFFRCSDRANFFLNALVLCFYLEHVQRITFCRCFLIFNQAVFCVDDGVVLWLKIKKSYYYYLYK